MGRVFRCAVHTEARGGDEGWARLGEGVCQLIGSIYSSILGRPCVCRRSVCAHKSHRVPRVRYIEEKPAPKWGRGGTPKKGTGTFDVQEVLDHRSRPDAGKGHGKMQYLVIYM